MKFRELLLVMIWVLDSRVVKDAAEELVAVADVSLARAAEPDAAAEPDVAAADAVN